MPKSTDYEYMTGRGMRVMMRIVRDSTFTAWFWPGNAPIGGWQREALSCHDAGRAWMQEEGAVIGRRERKSGQMLTIRRMLGLVATTILLGLFTLFVADNFVLVDVRIIAIDIQMRLAWALLIPAIGGFALGYLARHLRR